VFDLLKACFDHNIRFVWQNPVNKLDVYKKATTKNRIMPHEEVEVLF
jgi:hypothetical protein